MTTATHDARVAALLKHLEEHASLYLPSNHDPAVARLVRANERPQSQLYWFELRAGAATRTLLVKMSATTLGHPQRVTSDRPRIAPVALGSFAADAEFHALALIRRHFSGLDDPRFGSIEVFDQLPGRHGFVMEVVDWPNLRTVARHHGRWPRVSRRDDPRPAFRHAGAWLRVYHGLSAPRDVPELHTDRDEFVGFIDALTEYLERRTSEGSFFGWLRAAMRESALEHLPQRLPAALGHGDYAMRNILVGPGQRVIVLDTLARFRTSPYRDIGYFLADLMSSRLSALGSGALFHAARVPEYRRAFLEGYFAGEPAAEPQVRLYEAQVLLDRWAAIVSRAEGGTAVRLAAARAATVFLKRAIRDRLRGLGAPSRSSQFGAQEA